MGWVHQQQPIVTRVPFVFMGKQQINWDQCLAHAVLSDIGMRRSNNQDSYAVTIATDEDTWRDRGHVFLVADGMGAHAAGELASKLAADHIPHLYLKNQELSAPEALQKAVLDTNSEVHRKGQANIDFHNMGTTCSVLVLVPQGALVAHIGDSRVYRLRGKNLEQLTFDHSLVWEMQASGQLDENSDLAQSLPKNVITRSLGPNANVKVDIEGPFPLEIGDTFLLCSDGLTGKVEDDEIGPILATMAPKEAAQVLVDLANLRGGPDNITVVIAKVIGEELTSHMAAAEPITLGRDKDKKHKVHPILWLLLAACFLAALIMAAVQNFPVAGVAVAAALVCGVFIMLQAFSESSGSVAIRANQRLGRGPYVTVPSTPTSEFVQQLADVLRQLRDAAKEQDWEVDWMKLQEISKPADESVQAENYVVAARHYACGISFMMDQLRKQRRRNASDPSVDLI